IAIVASSRRELEQDAEKTGKISLKAKKVLILIEDPTRFLSTIQIGITMFGFINGAIAADAFASIISNSIATSVNLDILIVQPVVTVLITLVLTYLQVVLGELVPKRLAMKAPEKIAYTFVGFLSVIALIMRPFVALLTSTANVIVRLMGVSPNDNDDT